MKAHIVVKVDLGTVAKVNYATKSIVLVLGEEGDVFAAAGYQSVVKPEEMRGIKANWHVAICPGKRHVLNKSIPMGRVPRELEDVKARIGTKAVRPFRVIHRQFGFVKVRYRRLMNNTDQPRALCALSNLCIARHGLSQWVQRRLHLQRAIGPGWGLGRPRNRPRWLLNRPKQTRRSPVQESLCSTPIIVLSTIANP